MGTPQANSDSIIFIIRSANLYLQYLVKDLPAKEVSSKCLDSFACVLLTAHISNKVCKIETEANQDNQLWGTEM